MNSIVFLFTYIPFFTKSELFYRFPFDFLLICKPNCPIAVFSLQNLYGRQVELDETAQMYASSYKKIKGLLYGKRHK
jgi:hypothetical protein